ncbi:MAG: tetratricopeptide repeat protein, partial [Myxococcota bacterium]
RYDQGKIVEALDAYERAIDGLSTAYGAESGRVGGARLNRALCLVDLHRVEEGRAELRSALAILRASFGQESRSVAMALTNLGWATADSEPETAIGRYREAIAVYDALYGPDSVDALKATRALAKILARVRGRAAAVTELTPALAAATRTLGPDHALTRDLATLHAEFSGPALPQLRGAQRKAPAP